MHYADLAQKRAMEYRNKQDALLLAIESSCDETAAAVIRGGREVLSMTVFSQIPLHERYGGVVPELASRAHVEKISGVVSAALDEANCTLNDIGAIAVTHGPGLIGALLVGLSYAKGLALIKGLPFVGVNHIAGHIASNYLSHKALEPPFVCLVASGGHSHIVKVNDYASFALLGKTRDDAAGEAFDKVARALGLGYPGEALEALAREGNEDAFKFHSALNRDDSLEFSFSGIKTAAVNLLSNARQRGETLHLPDVAASFQRAVVETLTEKAVRAALIANSRTLALAGGVCANLALRSALQREAAANGLTFYCPSLQYCTDNAAMIGCAGHYLIMSGNLSDLDLNAQASLRFV